MDWGSFLAGLLIGLLFGSAVGLVTTALLMQTREGAHPHG